jgi:hypothetical protein
MRVFALALLGAALGAAPAGAAERVLKVEAEVLGAKEKSLGIANVLVAARGTERLKGTFGALTLVLDVEVGPTFDKECNLVTVSGRLEDSEAAGINKKRELKATTFPSCGKGGAPAPLPGAGERQVMITIRPGT